MAEIINLAEMRRARYGPAVYFIDGKLYALGAMHGFSTSNNEVESYDTVTYLPWLADIFGFNHWDFVTWTPRSTIVDASFTKDSSNRIHVVGGQRPEEEPLVTGNVNTQTPQTHVYDTRTNLWSTAFLNVPRSEIGLAAISDGRVLAVGGHGSGTGEFLVYIVNGYNDLAPDIFYPAGSTAAGAITIEQSLTVTEIYNPGSLGWSIGPPLTKARSSVLTVVDSKDRVYAIGGIESRTGNYFLADPGSDIWVDTISVINPGPTVVDNGTSFIGGIWGPGDYTPPDVGQFIYSGDEIHGSEPPGAPAVDTFTFTSSAVERWTPQTNSWETLPSTLEARAGTHVSGVVDTQDRVVIISRKGDLLNTWTAERFDPVANTWTSLGDFPIASGETFGILDSQKQTVWINLVNGYNNKRVFAGVTKVGWGPNEDSLTGGYYLYELVDDAWEQIYADEEDDTGPGIINAQIRHTTLFDDQQRFYYVGGADYQNDFGELNLFATARVNGWGAIANCVHGTANIESGMTIKVLATQEMALIPMPDINVEITDPHFDPCHPQTEANLIRTQQQVQVRNRKV